MKLSDYQAINSGVQQIIAALPEQFDHPAHAAFALANALALHCRLWGIPEQHAIEMLSGSFTEYQTRKH